MSGRKRPFMVPPIETDADMSIALARAKRNFSYRLFEALEADKRVPERFLYWSKDGTSFFVDDVQFEQQVMYVFPGLVATPTFKNLYRQLRVYGFDSIGASCDGKQQFAHPYFLRGREDLLIHVQSTINKGVRRKPSAAQSSPNCMSSPTYPHTQQQPYDLSSGDRSSGMIYAPYGTLPRLPDPIKLTSDVACQTAISMETFARLDPRDVSVSALMLPALVGFLDNCSEEARDREKVQYQQQINQEFQLLSSPLQEFKADTPPPQQQQQQQVQYQPASPPRSVYLSPQPSSQVITTPVHTPSHNMPPLAEKPVSVVTVMPAQGDPKAGARTLFNL